MRSTRPFGCYIQLLNPSPRPPPRLRVPEQRHIQRDPLAHPRRALRMISLLVDLLPFVVDRVRVDEDRQGTTVDHQPGDEGTELLGREEVHFEHCHGVGADGGGPELVDAELGDWEGSLAQGDDRYLTEWAGSEG
jgi:hypothetical protein